MLLKKIVSALFMPLTLGLAALAAGLILLWFTRRQRAARLVLTIGSAALGLFSCRPLSDLLMEPLENDFRPLLVDSAAADPRDAQARQARYIVVLGGGQSLDTRLPPNTELNEMTLARLIEALRLKRKLPQAKVILSGGFGRDGTTHADVLAGAAQALGFSPDDLVLEKRTFDTADEARLIAPIVGKDPFILVSSASHLPRAAALFRKQGATPLPSPTDFTVIDEPGVPLDAVFPSGRGVNNLERAVHEYLGRLWSRLRGQL
jgi:uncharacterized SAM-binding protein YcdF (DUF218 family)